MQRGRVVVVGSLNVDIVVRLPCLPGPGETVIGGIRQDHGGGKGANQAVAAARAGAAVGMVGVVGDDEAGRWSRAQLEAEGVGTRWLLADGRARTGTAMVVVMVDDRGENKIAMASGANGFRDRARVGEALAALSLGPGDACQSVLEVPDEALDAGAAMAGGAGCPSSSTPPSHGRWPEAVLDSQPPARAQRSRGGEAHRPGRSGHQTRPTCSPAGPSACWTARVRYGCGTARAWMVDLSAHAPGQAVARCRVLHRRGHR